MFSHSSFMTYNNSSCSSAAMDRNHHSMYPTVIDNDYHFTISNYKPNRKIVNKCQNPILCLVLYPLLILDSMCKPRVKDNSIHLWWCKKKRSTNLHATKNPWI